MSAGRPDPLTLAFFRSPTLTAAPQVYLLLSCCPCEGRISGIVDVPNACATLAVPLAIFDQDIRPKKGGPPVGPKLVTRGDVCKCTYGAR